VLSWFEGLLEIVGLAVMAKVSGMVHNRRAINFCCDKSIKCHATQLQPYNLYKILNMQFGLGLFVRHFPALAFGPAF